MRDEWIEWLQEKQRNFFFGVLIVVATFFCAFQLFGKINKSIPKNYLAANLAFERWILQNKDFDQVEKAIVKHPELESKFGALIADKFIVRDQGEKAQVFASNVFERVFKHTPHHVAFAQGSLFISKGELQAALNHSLSLNKELDKNSLLYGFNLFRIASLYRALDNSQQEHAFIHDLERFLQSNPHANAVLTKCFSEGELTLSNYLVQRKSKAANHKKSDLNS